jgi:hypothetical protein
VDGALAASNSAAITPQVYTGYWRWGGGTVAGLPVLPSSDYVDAFIDEVAIYPTALTPQQIAWHYHANH